MADPREPCGSVYIKKGGKNLRFVLFDSRQWPDQPEAAEGRYRVRVNRQWLRVQGRKYSFLTYAAIQLIAFREGATADALKALEQEPPAIQPKQRLQWIANDLSKPTKTVWAASTPYLGIDGLWRVPVYFLKMGHMVPGPHVSLDEILPAYPNPSQAEASAGHVEAP